MDDALLTLVLGLVLIAVVLTVIALPIVSIIISWGTRKRLSELHARIDRIEKTLGAHSIFPSDATPEPQTPPAPEPEPVIPPPQTIATPALNAYQLESIIGRRWAGWV